MRIKSFILDEAGAITVDWVVLTAAIVGLGAAVGIAVATSTVSLAGEVGDELATGNALIEHGS